MSQSDPQSPPLSAAATPDSPDRALSMASNTDATSCSDFYAAVASTPPCIDDWVAYPYDLSDSATRDARAARFPSESLPSPESLARAASMPVFDRDGHELPFSSLYQGRQYYGQQRLVVFIRHFYCRACKGFVRHLQQYFAAAAAKAGSANGPSIDKSIVIIGCGHHALIDQYAASTQCPYPIYADPSQKLMRALGCSRWAGFMPGERSEYTRENGNALKATTTSLVDFARALRPVCPPDCDHDHGDAAAKSGPGGGAGGGAGAKPLRRKFSRDALRGGPWLQVGGEFLFEQGELVWCHRMKNARGHMAPKTLRRVLDPVDQGPPPPAKDAPRSPNVDSSVASSPDLARLGSSKSAASEKRPTQVWSKAEYTLLPGSHIIQQVSSETTDESDDTERDSVKTLPVRSSPTTKNFPRSRLSARPPKATRESSAEA